MATRGKALEARTQKSVRTGLSSEALRLAVLDNLAFARACFPEIATPLDWYMGV